MKYAELTTDQRSSLLSPVAFHREHYRRLVSQLEAQGFPSDDRLRVAVTRAGEAVDSLLHLLAERERADVQPVQPFQEG